MDFEARLQLSYYREIAEINEARQIFLVQHIETKKLFVKKTLSVYNIAVYRRLMEQPVRGLPAIQCLYEDGNRLVLIEEYVSGNTLSELLTEEKPLPEQAVLRYALELCDILERLHSLTPPVIHRDIKPSNVMITTCGHVVLLDLNAAREVNPKEEDTVLLGTKGYAAPEQYGFGSSDIQADIYAVGMLINTLLTGSFSTVITDNRRFHAILERCTKINPQERFGSISELRQALAQLSPSARRIWAVGREHRFLPPGFRTGRPQNMIIAVPVYAFIIWMCLTLDVKVDSVYAMWFERLICLSLFLSIIVCCTDYLGIQRLMPLCSSEKRSIRYLGIFALILCLTASILFIFLFIRNSTYA